MFNAVALVCYEWGGGVHITWIPTNFAKPVWDQLLHNFFVRFAFTAFLAMTAESCLAILYPFLHEKSVTKLVKINNWAPVSLFAILTNIQLKAE